jgi:molybdopterin-containing oxidoreductase family iron-sulfur binding subunit
MTRWGMVIDLDRCNGCQACEVACRSENNIAVGGLQAAEENRTISWMRVRTEFEGAWPDLRARFVPQPCMHCERPPCTLVCPVQATSLDREGIVNQIYARCIGCRYCANACPYTVKYFNWRRPEHPDATQAGLNPDVSVRAVGVVEKCTFCSHRRQRARDQARAENRPLREQDYVPACAESCPTGAIVFGNLDDANHKVAQRARDPRAFRLEEGLGTQPKVYYLSQRD